MKKTLTALAPPILHVMWVGLFFSLAGLFFSGLITVEKLALAADSTHEGSCSFNSVVTCSPVMSSEQASAFFNIPNPLLGIAGFSVLACLFFIGLFVQLPRFIWTIASAGLGLALIFCFWLATQAIFVIGAICIYCVAVWACTTVLFMFTMKQTLKTALPDNIGDWLPLAVNVALILVLLTFGVMLFVGFPTYWLGFL